jgi:RNA polymerase sigma factor (sigma-70 family)
MKEDDEPKPESTVDMDLELVRRSQNGDQEAMALLMERHMGLITTWVSKLRWANPDDIKQEANIGFYYAVREFDLSQDSDFLDKARTYVKRAIYESKAVMPVNRTAYRRYRKVLKIQDELLQKLGRMPTLEELSTEAELSVKQVENALDVIAALPLQVEDGRLAIEERYENAGSYHAQLAQDLVKQLNSEDASLINLFYFAGLTDPEIAERWGQSKGAIKMARTRALKKLRDIIKRGSLKT